ALMLSCPAAATETQILSLHAALPILGGGNATPLDMAQGYAVFANGGYAVKPYVIESIRAANDEVLYRANPAVVCRRCEVDENERRERERARPPTTAALENGPLMQGMPYPGTAGTAGAADTAGTGMSLEQMAEVGESYRPDAIDAPELFEDVHLAPRVIPEQNAYLIQDMMRDVITRGTGLRARALGRSDLSGKTGTSNDQRDAWFAGFNGAISAVSWVGYDDPLPLGPGEQGSRTALPLWR